MADGADNSTAEVSDRKAFDGLLNFAVNNKNLDRLERILSRFNPFRVLGIADFEIRHSNVLAWLIDPNAHHGLGDSFFKSILLEILKENERNDLPKISEIINAEFSDLKVLREWRNIDVFAVSPMNKLLVVIENKWEASESENQLKKYAEIVDEKYPNYTKVYVLLTLDGVPPEGSTLYVPFKHEQIHRIVHSTVELRKDFMNSKVYDFIQQYLKMLEEKTVQNAEFIKLCSTLYREHGDAIRKIIEYGKPKLEPENIHDFHKRTNTESFQMEKGSVNQYYSFIPSAWSGVVPMTSLYSCKYLICFELNFSKYENNEVGLYLYISHFQEKDQEERREFVAMVDKALRDGSGGKHKINKSAKKSTTIFSKKIPLKDELGDYGLDDYDVITQKIVDVYNSDKVQSILKTVDGVVQEFWRKGEEDNV